MQPYFLPYIGYFQLMGAVDTFVVYDNIEYTKKGWINRNRMLRSGADTLFSLPLKKGSDSLHVRERELASDYSPDKLLSQFRGAYAHAPYFDQTWPLLERIVRHDEPNLFRYLHHSIVSMCAHLGLNTKICVSSDVAIDHELKGQDKVLALCRTMGAEIYINAIGGTELYAKDAFLAQGIELKFIRSRPFEYAQFGAPFVPWLSMVDVLMFNAPERVGAEVREGYELV